MAENTISNERTLDTGLFTETLRPKSLKAAIITPRIRQELEQGLIGNLLFYGTPGAGKTTLTRIMCAGHDVLEINASLERGIDTIREKVSMFASSFSIIGGTSKLKVVVLEECDNMTSDAWASLRALIEKYHNNVRFIANCNYIEKVPDPIQSRFNCISINPVNSEEEAYLIAEYEKRAGVIMSRLQITYTPENLKEFIKKNFPDMRSIVKKIQQIYTRGTHELTADMLSSSFGNESLYSIIFSTPSPWDNYNALITDWSAKADDAVQQMGGLPVYIHEKYPQLDSRIPEVIVEIAKHGDMMSRALDKFIVLCSLVFSLQKIIHRQ